ncbi:MAG: homoserine kinase [Elusimicrobiota bacterium]
MKKFKIKVPATTSNLGPGFDVIGAALKFYNDIEVKVGKSSGKDVPEIKIVGEGAGTLPTGKTNIVWQSIKKVLDSKKKSIDPGTLRIKLVNRIPLASGMGSSAAARLGGILAGYKLAGIRPSREDVMAMGIRLEGHPDNLVPAFQGGMCVCAKTSEGLKYLKLPVPRLKAVICHPDFELATDKSRMIIPRTLPLESAVFNLSRLALFISAGLTGRYEYLKYGMEDRLHQPSRSGLVPGMHKVFASALRAGAYGVSLSGAGPSIIALGKASKAKHIAKNMIRKWKQFDIASKCFILSFEKESLKI